MNLLGIETSSERQRARVACSHRSSSLFEKNPKTKQVSSSSSIRFNRFTARKKKERKGGHCCWPATKRKSLAQLLCSFTFHCKSNRHSLISPFPWPQLWLWLQPRLCPFSFVSEDNVHCLKVIRPERALRRNRGRRHRPNRGGGTNCEAKIFVKNIPRSLSVSVKQHGSF